MDKLKEKVEVGRNTLQDGNDSANAIRGQKHLVVVHKSDKSIAKGTLCWSTVSQHPAPLPPLPPVFDIDDANGTTSAIELTDIKALLFVRDHGGDPLYEEVKFFAHSEVLNLWVKVRMKDGELFEGRTENNLNLLTDPGLWLWPIDSFTNNLLVYIPKNSIAEFHIMAMAPRRPNTMTSVRPTTSREQRTKKTPTRTKKCWIRPTPETAYLG